ncbi:MAG: hypothetical protein AAGC70_18360, partial [Pseudomonadota bacterium]
MFRVLFAVILVLAALIVPSVGTQMEFGALQSFLSSDSDVETTESNTPSHPVAASDLLRVSDENKQTTSDGAPTHGRVAQKALTARSVITPETRPRLTTSPGDSAAASVPAERLVELAEIIQLRFQGYADITGDYRINGDHTISIPGIGRVDIAKLSARELEKVLSGRILAMTGREGAVSIEVKKYRDVFVSGFVASPGAIAWTRGMSVLTALSSAGGYYRPPTSGATVQPSTSSVRLLTIDLSQALILHARLKAELSDGETIQIPERLIGLIGLERSEKLVEAESSLLGNLRKSELATLKAINAGISATRLEIKRLAELKTSLQQRRAKLQKIVSKLAGAHKRGVVTTQRMLTAETTLAGIDDQIATTTVQSATIIAKLQELERDRIRQTEERRARLSKELATSRNTIDRLQAQLDIARKTEEAASGASDNASDIDTVYEIVRKEAGRPMRFRADTNTAVRP